VKLLVVDGYSKQGRDDLKAGGASEAGILYKRMLNTIIRKEISGGVDPTVDIVYPADEEVPLSVSALKSYHGVAWTGSSLTIYEDEPQVHRQIEFARKVFEAGTPQFGSCWALQVSVMSAGGTCGKNPRGREIGFSRKIMLTTEGMAHPMFQGKPPVFDAFTSHFDEASSLPVGASCLAGSWHTSIQACEVKYLNGTFWSIQYHPEYDLHELARLLYCRSPGLIEQGYFIDEADAKRYIETLELVHEDPGRKDLIWQLGLDSDILDEDIRQIEVSNWLRMILK